MSTIILAGALLTAWSDMGVRIEENANSIERNASEINHVKELDAINNLQMKDAIDGVAEQYEKIDKKLDKLIERELNGTH